MGEPGNSRTFCFHVIFGVSLSCINRLYMEGDVAMARILYVEDEKEIGQWIKSDKECLTKTRFTMSAGSSGWGKKRPWIPV